MDPASTFFALYANRRRWRQAKGQCYLKRSIKEASPSLYSPQGLYYIIKIVMNHSCEWELLNTLTIIKLPYSVRIVVCRWFFLCSVIMQDPSRRGINGREGINSKNELNMVINGRDDAH